MSLTTAQIIDGLESEVIAAEAACNTAHEAWAKAKNISDALFEKYMTLRHKPDAIKLAINALKAPEPAKDPSP